jgi:hypothetical protein
VRRAGRGSFDRDDLKEAASVAVQVVSRHPSTSAFTATRDYRFLSQYWRMTSCDQTGWRISCRGRNSTITGLMSITGVPLIASSAETKSLVPSTRTTWQTVLPMRLGRFLPRCAKIPTTGHSGLLLG